MVYNKSFPLCDITDFDTYTCLRCPNSKTIGTTERKFNKSERTKRIEKEKEIFLNLVFVQGLKIAQAAQELHVTLRTLYNWYRACKNKNSNYTSETLNDEQKEFLAEKYSKNLEAKLSEMLESLFVEFNGLRVPPKVVASFMNKKHALVIKSPQVNSQEKNQEYLLTARSRWVARLRATEADYQTNCVFIDKFKAETRVRRNAISKDCPDAHKTRWGSRWKSTEVLAATTSKRVIKLEIKVEQDTEAIFGKLTRKRFTKDNYADFISGVLDELDCHEEYKGCYLMVNQSRSHTLYAIANSIVSRGYKCIYLPPYSSDLIPVEQFWFEVKNNVKEEILKKGESLFSRVADACSHISSETLQKHCRYSESKLQSCLNKEFL